MDVDLELQLESRLDDRVVVSLWLSPAVGSSTRVDGAALRLVDARGDELCPRHLLPVVGSVSGVMALTVELRASGAIPDGSRVLGTVWAGMEQVQASCPADPFVSLREHMRGSRLGLPDEDEVELSPLEPATLARLEKIAPWVGQPLRPPEVSGVIEAREPARTADDLARDLDLDADTASWLEDLLEGDDA